MQSTMTIEPTNPEDTTMAPQEEANQNKDDNPAEDEDVADETTPAAVVSEANAAGMTTEGDTENADANEVEEVMDEGEDEDNDNDNEDNDNDNEDNDNDNEDNDNDNDNDNEDNDEDDNDNDNEDNDEDDNDNEEEGDGESDAIAAALANALLSSLMGASDDNGADAGTDVEADGNTNNGQDRDSSNESEYSMLKLVLESLDAMGLSYNNKEVDSERNVIDFRCNITTGSFRCVCDVKHSDDKFIVYLICPIVIPEDQRVRAAEYFTYANYGLNTGNFELDMNDGEFRFKNSVHLAGSKLSKEMVVGMFLLACRIVDRYCPGFFAVVFGGKSPRDACAAVDNPASESTPNVFEQ